MGLTAEGEKAAFDARVRRRWRWAGIALIVIGAGLAVVGALLILFMAMAACGALAVMGAGGTCEVTGVGRALLPGVLVVLVGIWALAQSRRPVPDRDSSP